MSMSCVSFSFLLVPARASSSWLQQEGAHRDLVSILGQKVSPFTVKKFAVSAGFPGCSLSGWGSLLSSWIDEFCQMFFFFFCLRKLPCDFSSLFCWYGELHPLIWMVKQNLPSWMNPTWGVVFSELLDLVCLGLPWARHLHCAPLSATPAGHVARCCPSSPGSLVSP